MPYMKDRSYHSFIGATANHFPERTRAQTPEREPQIDNKKTANHSVTIADHHEASLANMLPISPYYCWLLSSTINSLFLLFFSLLLLHAIINHLLSLYMHVLNITIELLIH